MSHVQWIIFGSCIYGYYEYQTIWELEIDKELDCSKFLMMV